MLTDKNTAMKNKMYHVHLPKKRISFSRYQAVVFGIIFALIGVYLIWHSAASTPIVATVEAEQMTLPAGASAISDTGASGGQAILLTANGTASSAASLSTSATSVSVTARATKCHGWPALSLGIDGTSHLSTSVSTSSWGTYSATFNVPIGTHTLTLTGSSLGRAGNCTRSLYLDVTNFYGPATTPAPTIAFSASSTNITAGASSTLTWTSTNASTCTASGAWSGTQPTSGSASTGALNNTATYALACTGTGGTANASVTVTVNSTTPPSTGSVYWGGWTHYVDFCSPGTPSYSCDSPWVMSSQSHFEQDAGKTASIIQFSSSLKNQVDTTALNNIWNHGSIPLYALGTSGYTDASVANGTADTTITSLAKSIAAWGHPMFVRLDWEMNASWFGWGVGNSGNTVNDFINMWRHVHDVFVTNGAKNVSWVWTPNIDPGNHYAPLSSVYPGDAYVDWTGFDGYSDNSAFDAMAKSTYSTIVSIAPSKPLMIAETGAHEGATSPTKPAYITDLLTQAIPVRYPQIRAIVWFESEEASPGCSAGSSCSWIESSTSAQQAFASGIALGKYLSAGHLPTTSPIAAP